MVPGLLCCILAADEQSPLIRTSLELVYTRMNFKANKSWIAFIRIDRESE